MESLEKMQETSPESEMTSQEPQETKPWENYGEHEIDFDKEGGAKFTHRKTDQEVPGGGLKEGLEEETETDPYYQAGELTEEEQSFVHEKMKDFKAPDPNSEEFRGLMPNDINSEIDKAIKQKRSEVYQEVLDRRKEKGQG